jgi:alpha-galactosidase
LLNSEGCKPQKIGKLPEQLAALMRTNINVQILTAEAAITKKREHIYHAALLDPLTGANLTIDEIYKMVDELLIAHQNFLPKYN